MVRSERENREERFWDEHVATLDACLARYRTGPEPNTLAAIEALEPLDGKEVLDLGCGTGELSAWLASRGAHVTGIDVSPASIARAQELAAALHLDIAFVAEGFPSSQLDGRRFDRIAGKYILHHLDLRQTAPALARLLVPGGKAAFIETMATNPLLLYARRFLVGRFGVPRLGTIDEKPLDEDDLAVLARTVGPLRLEVAELRFLRILDRQVLGFRRPAVSRVLGVGDDLLHRLGLDRASYHQVVVLTRAESSP
jgi:SAM-dependent methyltransferase